jgi:hypothetical protein
MRSTRHFALALAFLAAALLAPAAAHACSCIQPPPPAEALEQADAVFVGTVAAIDPADGPAGFPKLAVRFDLETVFKGDLDGEAVVETPESSAACGYTFEEGETYLVYAFEVGEGEGWSTSLCSRNAKAEKAEEDLAVFEGVESGEAEEDGEGEDGDCGGGR